MTKSLRTSFGAKCAAAILLYITSAVLILSVIGVFVLDNRGIYSSTKEKALETATSEVLHNYSVSAVVEYAQGVDSSFDAAGFRYQLWENKAAEKALAENPALIYESMKALALRYPIDPETRCDTGNAAEIPSPAHEELFFFEPGISEYNETVRFGQHAWIDPLGAVSLFYDPEEADPGTLPGTDGLKAYTVISWFDPQYPAYRNASYAEAGEFRQMELIYNTAYTLRYPLIAAIPVAGILSVLLLLFLIRSAGYRKDGTVKAHFFDRIPLDLNLFLVILAVSILLILTEDAVHYFAPVIAIPLAVGTTAASYLLILGYILSWSVNARLGNPLKNTLIRHLCRGIAAIFRILSDRHEKARAERRARASHLLLKPRFWALFGILSACEFIGILVFGGSAPLFLLILWVLEKAGLFFLFRKILEDYSRLKRAGEEIAGGQMNFRVNADRMLIDFAQHGENLNRIGEGLTTAVSEQTKSERMKAELITNVSHDIKTPLTSIINYTDLLTRLDLKNPAADEYLGVLSRQSQRLKKLIEDLIEASKASSGTLRMNREPTDLCMVLTQAAGEFSEKLTCAGIDLRTQLPDRNVTVNTDGRYLWRVFDNLLSNICKYALPGSRAYVTVECKGDQAVVVFRNISKEELNISADELMERFVRGDKSRSREGSGLGLSIARSLAEMMGGTFSVTIDGDLFKVSAGFPLEASGRP